MMLDMKEKFQTIGRTYTKALWSREDRACTRQNVRSSIADGEGEIYRHTQVLGKYLANQNSQTDCPGLAQATPTIRLRDSLSPSILGADCSWGWE